MHVLAETWLQTSTIEDNIKIFLAIIVSIEQTTGVEVWVDMLIMDDFKLSFVSWLFNPHAFSHINFDRPLASPSIELDNINNCIATRILAHVVHPAGIFL